jgi:hypothetical protein
MEDFLTTIFNAAEIAFQVLLELWKIILVWAQESLSSWISDNLSPQYKKLSTEALVILDKLSSPLRKLAKIAWKELRKFIVSSMITFEKKVLPNGKFQWYRNWSSKIINVVEPRKPHIETRTETTDISFEDLPNDVREALIRSGHNKHEINFLDGRDREMEQIVA